MSTAATEHVERLRRALDDLDGQAAAVAAWGRELAEILGGGGRLLLAGNGGSAAHAQHLTGELVGRYRDERRPLSAIALHAETTSLTAIVNDYGADEAFARQALAHGRPGDVLLLLSTSGRSPNLLRAAEAGREAGLRVWGLTGPRPNPLAGRCEQAVCVEAGTTATIQEAHQVVVHLVCDAVDAALAAPRRGHMRLVRGTGG